MGEQHASAMPLQDSDVSSEVSLISGEGVFQSPAVEDDVDSCTVPWYDGTAVNDQGLTDHLRESIVMMRVRSIQPKVGVLSPRLRLKWKF